MGTQPPWPDTLLVSQVLASSLPWLHTALEELIGGSQVVHKMQRQAAGPWDRTAATQTPLCLHELGMKNG